MSIHFTTKTLKRFRTVNALLERLDPQGEPGAVITPESAEPHGMTIVFPSSFNPPTIAHLALLQQGQAFARQLGPEGEMAGSYAALSKHIVDKERVERPLILDRVVLLETVLRRHLPGTGIMLFNRGLYMEQAQAVRTCFPAVTKLYFLVGFDKIVQIFDPRYYGDRDAALNELFRLAEVLVAPRGTAGADEIKALLQQPANQPFAHYVHTLPFDPAYRNLSSTEIRQAPQAHSQDIPIEVQHFMETTHAYDPPPQHTQHEEHRTGSPAQIDAYGKRVKTLLELLKTDATPEM